MPSFLGDISCSSILIGIDAISFWIDGFYFWIQICLCKKPHKKKLQTMRFGGLGEGTTSPLQEITCPGTEPV